MHSTLRTTPPRRVLLALLPAGLLVAACGDGAPAPCKLGLEAAVRVEALMPETPPHRPPPLVLPAEADGDEEALLVDPSPLARGEHPVLRFTRDPDTCAVAGEPRPWGPPPGPVPEATGLVRSYTPPEPKEATVRALLVTGADPGAPADAAAWGDALEALGAFGFHLQSPDRATLEKTLAALCADVGPGDTALLVTAGRATPAGSGALLLGPEAVSRDRVLEVLATDCAPAGLRIWVDDGAWAAGVEARAEAAAPLVLWRASDAAHPDAPRVAPAGGGLLSAALAAHVEARARERCMRGASPGAGPAEVADVFDGAAAVRARMETLRWEAVGAEALEAAESASREEVEEAVFADLPVDVRRAVGEPLPLPGCEDDVPCLLRTAGCGLPTCRTLLCSAGRCVPAPDLGEPCDDGSPCTEEDRCDGNARCVGEPVDCSDGNPCTGDGCDETLGCVHEDIDDGEPCDDGDVCTLDDLCDGGACGGDPRDCDDGDPCTEDLCDAAAGCLHEVEDLPCDDGDPCTHQDFCEDGFCRGRPLPCDDGAPCTLDLCTPEEGCTFPAAPPGLSCDDADPCTTLDRCQDGTCAGIPTACDDGIACTVDLCDAGGCVHLAPPGSCATASGCIPVGEHPPGAPCLVCASTNSLVPDAALEGGPCADDGIACTADRCEAGACVHRPQPGFCTAPDGACVPVGQPLAPCLTCVATGVAATASPGSPCDDGDPCTEGDVCGGDGLCRGTERACCPAGADLACGVTLDGDTSLPGTPDQVDVWACLGGLAFTGPERTHRFVAPCDGLFTFDLEGVSKHILLILRGEDLPAETACQLAQCDTYTAGSISQPLAEGQEIRLVVDGNADGAGPYTLSVECACAPEGP